jgi:hypothetical protein
MKSDVFYVFTWKTNFYLRFQLIHRAENSALPSKYLVLLLVSYFTVRLFPDWHILRP